MIRVLIVDDSSVVRMLLRSLIVSGKEFSVVAEAANGLEAVAMTKKYKPDIITMDVRMPILNGFEATQAIMQQCPTPILVVSASVNNEDLKITFNAIKAGALGVIEKPPGVHGDTYEEIQKNLLSMLRIYSEIKVVTRRYDALKSVDDTIKKATQVHNKKECKIVVMGGSTGAPGVFQRVLADLVSLTVPLILVQHMSKGFTNGFVSWLNDTTPIPVSLPKQGEVLAPGHVYVVPSGVHGKVFRSGGSSRFLFEEGEAVMGFCPSVDVLFDSVAKSYDGCAMGGLLTGMGEDGARGLLAMKQSGCHTFIQDESSSVVYGMPGAADKLDAACSIVPAADIANYILQNS